MMNFLILLLVEFIIILFSLFIGKTSISNKTIKIERKYLFILTYMLLNIVFIFQVLLSIEL